MTDQSILEDQDGPEDVDPSKNYLEELWQSGKAPWQVW